MTKSTKARKYNSSILQELLDEVTPVEMEQTKIKMQLAARIEDLMLSKGWSKTQLAEKVGKNPSEITKWFSGTQNLTTDVLTEIAFAFGVDIATLFDKKPVQVIYETKIVVRSAAYQPYFILITPTGVRNGICRNYSSSRSQKAALPIKQYQQV